MASLEHDRLSRRCGRFTFLVVIAILLTCGVVEGSLSSRSQNRKASSNGTGESGKPPSVLGRGSSRPPPSTASATNSLESSLTPFVSGRKACGLYIWDAPSAFLHAWCTRLMKDCVYEGRGGTKFVRIHPGSMLQLLYPCTRYSPDRCLICGGSFRDHLTLWWSKHLYTPLDRLLDQTYESGVVVTIPGPPNVAAHRQASKSRRTKTIKTEARPMPSPKPQTQFVFHRRYIQEPIPKPETRRSKKSSATKQQVSATPRRWTIAQSETTDLQQVGSSPSKRRAKDTRKRGHDKENDKQLSFEASLLSVGGVLRIPQQSKKPTLSLVIAQRFIVAALDNLLDLEQEEATHCNKQQLL